MKGLLEAIGTMASMTAECKFVVYGNIEDVGYWARCNEAAMNLPANVVFEFRGSFQSSDTPGIFDEATAFLLPTHGEGFGHAIAEALSVGCPVVVSTATPWGAYMGDEIGCISDDPSVWLSFLEEILEEEESVRIQRRTRISTKYGNWAETQWREATRLFELALGRSIA